VWAVVSPWLSIQLASCYFWSSWMPLVGMLLARPSRVSWWLASSSRSIPSSESGTLLLPLVTAVRHPHERCHRRRARFRTLDLASTEPSPSYHRKAARSMPRWHSRTPAPPEWGGEVVRGEETGSALAARRAGRARLRRNPGSPGSPAHRAWSAAPGAGCRLRGSLAHGRQPRCPAPFPRRHRSAPGPAPCETLAARA